MKKFFQTLLTEGESLEEFGEWAFGPKYLFLEKGLEFLCEWNINHSSELHLLADSLIGDDAPRMIQLWRDSKDKKK